MMKLYWTRHGIPHGYLCATPIHLVYRVEGCAPVGELRRLSDELKEQLRDLRAGEGKVAEAQIQQVLQEHLYVYDALLDAQDQSRYVLMQPQAREEVLESWQTLQRMGLIVLYAVCVMGNHVHVLFRGADGGEEAPVGGLVRQHKSYTNRMVKRHCGLTQDVWDDGFYDRYVRYGTFQEVLWYLLNNPVKAGLVKDWREWAGTWVDERCLR